MPGPGAEPLRRLVCGALFPRRGGPEPGGQEQVFNMVSAVGGPGDCVSNGGQAAAWTVDVKLGRWSACASDEIGSRHALGGYALSARSICEALH